MCRTTCGGSRLQKFIENVLLAIHSTLRLGQKTFDRDLNKGAKYIQNMLAESPVER